MLTGQAKTDYQRTYMRRRRAVRPIGNVRPKVLDPVRPKEIEPWPYIPVPDDYDLDEALSHPLPDFDADGNLIPEIE